MSSDQKNSGDDVADVQERLMRMLDSVRLDKSAESVRPSRSAPPHPVPAHPVAVETASSPLKQQESAGSGCSHCGSTVPWNGSAWCPSCGFHPTFGRVVVEITPDEEPAPVNLREVIPGWLYWLLGIIFVLLVESLVFRVGVPDINIRGQIAILQLIVGLAIYLVAHTRAFFVASHLSEKIGPGSFVYDPGNIWKLVFQKLPETNRVVIGGASGLAAAFLAVALVGIDWNALFATEQQANKPKFNPLKAVMQGAMMVANMKQGGDMSGGMADMAGGLPDAQGDPLAGSISAFADLSGGGMLAQGAAASPNTSMEDALSDFAGNAGVDHLTAVASNPGSGASSGSGDIGSALSNFSQAAGVSGFQDSGGSAGTQDIGGPQSGLNHQSGKGNGSGIGIGVPPGSSSDTIQTVATRGDVAAPKAAAKQEQGTYYIFGYLTNAGGEMRSILLAECDDAHRGRYVGRLSLVGFDETRLAELKKVLDEYRSETPALPAPYRARWTQLVVKCVVVHEGNGADGNLRNGQLISFEKDLTRLKKSTKKVASSLR